MIPNKSRDYENGELLYALNTLTDRFGISISEVSVSVYEDNLLYAELKIESCSEDFLAKYSPFLSSDLQLRFYRIYEIPSDVYFTEATPIIINKLLEYGEHILYDKESFKVAIRYMPYERESKALFYVWNNFFYKCFQSKHYSLAQLLKKTAQGLAL